MKLGFALIKWTCRILGCTNWSEKMNIERKYDVWTVWGDWNDMLGYVILLSAWDRIEGIRSDLAEERKIWFRRIFGIMDKEKHRGMNSLTSIHCRRFLHPSKSSHSQLLRIHWLVSSPDTHPPARLKGNTTTFWSRRYPPNTHHSAPNSSSKIRNKRW